MSDGTKAITRRAFVRRGAGAGAGLVLAVHLPVEALGGYPSVSGGAAADFQPNAWIRVAPDGVVTIVVDEAEMGQGTRTGLPMFVADEMDADWSMVRPGPIPENPAGWPRSIATGGSTSIRLGWEPLRRAGAAAREMLREAAARRWGVEPSACRTEAGRVHGPGGRSLGYGELAVDAAALPVPDDPPLKDPSDFRLVGRRLPRNDLREKGTGATIYGTDVRLEGMRYAVLARPPAFGATVAGFDDRGARAVDGVIDVFRTPHGVAVVAEDTWSALKGREALSLEWDRSGATTLDSATMGRRASELVERDGQEVEARGDVEAALGGAARRVQVDYELPFLDHATMEPMNTTVRVGDGRVELWTPTQVATAAQEAAARTAGVAPERVRMHVPLLGGGFGRRLQVDYVVQAVALAMEMPGVPVQLFWTREDTTRHGAYRPYTYHRMRAGLDADGRPVAWHHRLVGVGSRGGVVGGATEPPYRTGAFRVDVHLPDWNVPTGALRSVGFTQNGFAVEAFVDELAAAAGWDPYEYRRDLMTDTRLRNVLDLAADRAGWGSALPEGRGRGIAAVHSYGSWVAQVAEVTVEDGEVSVDRVVAAVDCGIAVNPDSVESQIEGGVAFGLTHALKGAITLEAGGVREGNFTDYPLLTIREMPRVEVHVVDSSEPPGGVGEPGVPPVAPAVANAVYAATGRRVRSMPIRMETLGTV